jgi:two-component system copper resistance phosphate regulon response regulator CusR
MLPKLNGWSVITGIRQVHPETRVLFLTARNDLEDRIKGLELGADDYLVKPFAFSELLARVRALLRRGTYHIPHLIQIADLTIDCVKHKVTRGALRIDLTPKEFSLLVYLARHQGEVLSRTLIAENVWDIHFDNNSNVIDVALRRMRQKIDDPCEKKLIHTVRGIGYVLEER